MSCRMVVVVVVCLVIFAVSAFGQMGTGNASGVTVDCAGNVFMTTVVAGAEIGPAPYVSLVDETVSNSQSVTAANLDLQAFESNSGGNVATVSTSYDATIGAQAYMSFSEVDNVDVLADILIVGNFVTVTASNITTTADVTGVCGSGGNMDLVEAGSSMVEGLTVSVLGINILNNVTTSDPMGIDLSTTALGALGVTGSLFINRVTLGDGGATGTGSATAVGLELSVNAGVAVVGLGNTAEINISIAESFASRDCDSLPVELMAFTVE